jgi:hypothetical protein
VQETDKELLEETILDEDEMWPHNLTPHAPSPTGGGTWAPCVPARFPWTNSRTTWCRCITRQWPSEKCIDAKMQHPSCTSTSAPRASATR